jgi:DnaK suppressor protein
MEAIVNIDQYKRRLQAEEQRLLKSVDRIQANARELSGDSVRDRGDASVSDEEKAAEFQNSESELATLNQVRDALKRIEESTFGKCVVDGGPIEEKRLEAVPWTPYCLKHEQLLEQAAPRRTPTL